MKPLNAKIEEKIEGLSIAAMNPVARAEEVTVMRQLAHWIAEELIEEIKPNRQQLTWPETIVRLLEAFFYMGRGSDKRKG